MSMRLMTIGLRKPWEYAFERKIPGGLSMTVCVIPVVSVQQYAGPQR
jgi:hypothetical protein